MAALNSANSFDKLLDSLRKALPDVQYEQGDAFCWSPKKRTITYQLSSDEQINNWSLLHEAGHASLNHTGYDSDYELLMLEVAAWKKAKSLSTDFSHEISEEHIQDCLDSYRDWLHQRSTCPTCSAVGLQHNPKEYRCHNCLGIWSVTASRFCRPYRSKQAKVQKKSPVPVQQQTTFQ